MGFTNTDDACQNIYAPGGGSLPAITYSSICAGQASSTPRLLEFVNSGYVIGEPGGATHPILKYFAGTGPATLKNKPNVVTGYLGYPVGSFDYRKTPLQLAELNPIIQNIIKDGNLINDAQLYMPSDFQTAPSDKTASLIYLYQQSSQKALTPAQVQQKNTIEAINLNFFGEVMAEFCYYKRRYLFLLKKYFDVARYDTYAPGGPDVGIESIGGSQATSNQNLPTKQTLNMTKITYYMECISSRLADLNELLKAINIHYTTFLANTSKNLADGGKTFTNQENIESKLISLKSSSSNINTLQSEADYRKSIVQYTEEKNRYSNILLGLYAFLNIAAISIIINLRE
jgi:hypothetical protein